MRHQNRNIDILATAHGLKLVCMHIPGARVEYCGAVVRVGSRDDEPDAPGMAHFIEHTLFKGTARRSSWHIINRMERVGGELNAYTSKEETVVYTIAPSGNLDRAMELLGDLLASSRFPESELEKEREVVADEINSYLDTPSEAVYDDFEELIFAGTPLSHNILGDVQALATFDSEKCRKYLEKWYVCHNMVVFYSGPANVERVAKVVESRFADLPYQDAPEHQSLELPYMGKAFACEKALDLHQSHTLMGAVVGGIHSPQRFTIDLLANILGGPGMNSMLNVQLREKRGLVYSVEASTSLLTDCGLCTIYFGCDSQDTQKCQDLVNRQIHELASQPMSTARLAAAKKQFLGQQYVASDNRENITISLARAALYFDHLLTMEEIVERIDSITAEQLRMAAESMCHLSSLTLK